MSLQDFQKIEPMEINPRLIYLAMSFRSVLF
jgi:hypothetical protein